VAASCASARRQCRRPTTLGKTSRLLLSMLTRPSDHETVKLYCPSKPGLKFFQAKKQPKNWNSLIKYLIILLKSTVASIAQVQLAKRLNLFR
jgi:hypothetical protein